jgi:glycosyltransferase involved in cell wall biosynthesis
VSENKPRLRILHIDPERGWGGGERQVLSLAEYLLGQGHDCHLLCHSGGPLDCKAQEKGCKTLGLKIRNEFDPRPVVLFRGLLRRERYDIVHFHTKRAHALSLWLGRPAAISKSVVTRRMDYPLTRNWYNRYIYNRKTDGVIAISRRIADVLIEAGVSKQKVRVIYSGIDPRPFGSKAFRRWGERTPVIGTVAALFERKGHRFLLEGAARLQKRGFKLRYRFAGEGPEMAELRKQTVELGLEPQVSFEGFVSDVAAFLNQVDIFVLPSLYEGLGVAILEAMAAGKPIVASRVGGIPELIQHLATGLLVPPGDSEALAQAISRLVSEQDLAENLATRAREKVREEFTIEQMGRKNEAFYYELLQHERG